MIRRRVPRHGVRPFAGSGAVTVPVAMLALALAGPPPVTAKALLGEPEVDRASDQYDGLWCPAEQILSFDGSFVADGPRATFEFVATNHSNITGDWRHERIDNIFVVPAATYATYKHLPDSALAAAFGCLEPNRNYFHFNEVPPAEIVFEERFPFGPGPDWDLSHGAYANPGSSALNALALPLESSGQSLGLGLDAVPTFTATTEVTVDGLTAGQSYVVTTWTQCADASVGSDLVIRIYGTEFFHLAGSQPVDPGPGQGCAWGDYDGDGDPDLYVADYSTVSRLFRNDPGGFVDVTVPSGAGVGTTARAAAWADVDNDGDLDLYIAVEGPNVYLRNDGGLFHNATSGALGDARQASCMDWGDYDRDGDLDLFLGNSETDALLRNDGGSFADVAAGDLLGSGRAIGCSWVDSDDDGDLDLFVTYNAQPNELLRNDHGTFHEATPAVLAAAGPFTTGAWADYDDDGDLDAYLSMRDAPNRLCRNDGGGAFADVTPASLLVAGRRSESVWGDWDNDGRIDIYSVLTGQPNVLFRNDGGNSFGVQATGTVEDAGLGAGAAWADYDRDGDLDLHVVNGGADVLYRNEFGSERHWLHVDLRGVQSNRSGVGAKVFVTSGGKTRMREVGGESGFRSQMSITAEFGLGSATVADLIRVEWPSGIVQTLGGIPADQRILIIEHAPTAVAEAADPGPAAITLRGGAPNPFRDASSISYSLPAAATVELRVLDVRGRLVRIVESGIRGAGQHRAEWDGRDRTGRPAAPGLYFAELRAGGQSVTRKLVRVGTE